MYGKVRVAVGDRVCVRELERDRETESSMREMHCTN